MKRRIVTVLFTLLFALVTFVPGAHAQLIARDPSPPGDPPACMLRRTPQPDFRADRYTLNPGECTKLHWDIDEVQSVFLGHAGSADTAVAGHASEEVCPSGDMNYNLRILARDGRTYWYELWIHLNE